jgi:hypothetical protein
MPRNRLAAVSKTMIAIPRIRLFEFVAKSMTYLEAIDDNIPMSVMDTLKNKSPARLQKNGRVYSNIHLAYLF